MTTLEHQHEQGFTAIELLVTLIIAAVFLFAGYQLFTQVVREGANANTTARLSNAAYAKLRAETALLDTNYPTGCDSSFAQGATNSTQTITGLGDVSYVTTKTCPYLSSANSAQNVFLIRVDASINGGATTVSHATLAN